METTFTVRKIEHMWVLEESPSRKWVCCSDSAKYFRKRCKMLGVPFDAKAPTMTSPMALDIVPGPTAKRYGSVVDGSEALVEAPAETPVLPQSGTVQSVPAETLSTYGRYYKAHRKEKLAYLVDWHKRNRERVLIRQRARYHRLKDERAAAAAVTT